MNLCIEREERVLVSCTVLVLASEIKQQVQVANVPRAYGTNILAHPCHLVPHQHVKTPTLCIPTRDKTQRVN